MTSTTDAAVSSAPEPKFRKDYAPPAFDIETVELSFDLGEDGTVVGGVYWWRDRVSAEARFGEGWRAGVTAKYGAPPTIEWFDAPVVVDNRTGSVIDDHAGPPE